MARRKDAGSILSLLSEDTTAALWIRRVGPFLEKVAVLGRKRAPALAESCERSLEAWADAIRAELDPGDFLSGEAVVAFGDPGGLVTKVTRALLSRDAPAFSLADFPILFACRSSRAQELLEKVRVLAGKKGIRNEARETAGGPIICLHLGEKQQSPRSEHEAPPRGTSSALHLAARDGLFLVSTSRPFLEASMAGPGGGKSILESGLEDAGDGDLVFRASAKLLKREIEAAVTGTYLAFPWREVTARLPAEALGFSLFLEESRIRLRFSVRCPERAAGGEGFPPGLPSGDPRGADAFVTTACEPERLAEILDLLVRPISTREDGKEGPVYRLDRGPLAGAMLRLAGRSLLVSGPAAASGGVVPSGERPDFQAIFPPRVSLAGWASGSFVRSSVGALAEKGMGADLDDAGRAALRSAADALDALTIHGSWREKTFWGDLVLSLRQN